MVESAVQSHAEIVVDSIEKSKIRVLHVDDELGLLKVAKQCLELQGPFHVDTAGSVEEALNKLKEKEYDVVVSDYLMPRKDGLQFLEMLRKNGNTIPFIMFTGKGREEVAIRALNIGANQYLNKTGETETVYMELAHTITELAKTKKAEEALRQSEERYRNLFENAKDVIILFDLKGNVTSANKGAEKYGFNKSGMLGKNMLKFVSKRYWPKLLKDVVQIALGKTAEGRIEIHTPKGDKIAEYRSNPIFSGNRVVGIQTVLEDTTEHEKAEETLRESEEKYRNLFEGAMDAIVTLDLKGSITAVNSSVLRFGYEKEDLVGKNLLDFVSKEYWPAVMRDFSKVAQGEPAKNEVELVVPTGKILVEYHAGAIVKENNVAGVQINIRDVTERKKSEELLRESEERFRGLFESIQDPVGIFVGREGRLIDYNTAFKKSSGYTDEELKGKAFLDFVHPDDHAMVLEKYQTKYSEEELPLVYEIRGMNKKGESIPLELSVSTYKKKGKVIGIEVIHRDITERRKAEELVRASEERYRSYIEVTGQLGWTTNANGEVEEDIPAWRKFTGQSHEEVKGWGWTKALHPDDLEHTTQVWEKAVAAKSSYEVEYRIRRYDGVYRNFLAHGVPVSNEAGSIQEWVGTCIDITERKKAEQALKQSEEKYRSLVELAPDGIVAVNAEGIVTSVNRSFLTLVGYDSEEIVGKPFTELKTMQMEDIPRFQGMFKSLMKGESSSPSEFLYVRRDGTSRWAEVHPGLLVRDGNPVGVQVIMRDVSERKNAEKLIQENQRKFEQLFMSNPEAAVYVDPNERVLNVNPRFTELFGYSFDEVKEKSLDDFVVPEDRRKEALMLAQKGREGYIYHETVRKNKKGSLIPVTLSSAPIVLQGQHIGDIVLYKDITERKQWEDALRDAKEKWASLTENTDDIVMVVDGNGVIQYISRTIPPYTPGETVGKTVYEYVPREQHGAFEKSLREVFKTGEPDSYQVSSNVPKIGTIWFSTKVVPIKHDGRVSAAILISSNITDRKKAEEELCRAMKKLDVVNEKLRVVGGLTRHDVNNKLTAVAGYTYLARNKLQGNSEVLDYLKQIEASVEQTVKIFDFAKAYEMLGVEELVHVDVEKSVNEAISLFSGLKDIKVINDCHGLTVLADSLLRTLFYNLVDDSLKYGEKLSRIRVYYEEKNSDHLNLIYEDDGVGIPQAAKPKLFGEGYSTGKGSGYGLYLIKKMMEVYGWTIREAGTPGKGAQFTITVPRLDESGRENYQLR